MTANACKRQVAAGPVEATALGNIAVQLIASGDIRDLSEARRSIAGSEKLTVYQPESPMQWDKAYEDFKHIIRR